MTTLDDLERLHEAATPGPWWVEPEGAGGDDRIGWVSDAFIAYGTQGDPAETYDLIEAHNVETDYALIAAARNALPALLRVARAAIIVHKKRRAMWDDPRSAAASAAASIALDRLDDALAALAALEVEP